MTATAAFTAITAGTQSAQGQAGQSTAAARPAAGGIFAALLAQLLQFTQTAAPAVPAGTQATTSDGTQNAQPILQPKASAAGLAHSNSALLQIKSELATVKAQPSSAVPQSEAPTAAPQSKPSHWLATLSGRIAQRDIPASAQFDGSTQAPSSHPGAEQNGQILSQILSLLSALVPSATPPAAQTAAIPNSSSGSVDSIAGDSFDPVAPSPASQGLPAPSQSQAQTNLPASRSVAPNTPSATPSGLSPWNSGTLNPASTTPASQAAAPAGQTLAASLALLPTNPTSNTGSPAATNNAQHQAFAQASHDAAHQSVATATTEANALSLNLNFSPTDGASSSVSQPRSNHAATSAGSQSSEQQAGLAGDPGAGASVQPTIPAAHDATAQNGGSNPSPNAAVASASTTPANPQLPNPAPTTNFTLQVGPSSQTSDSSSQPNVQAIAVSIASQSQAGSKQFNIRLDPPELGRVDVRLTVDMAGKAQAHLAVDKPQTLELLQRDSGSLARALKDSGVQLNNNGLQFSLKGQDRQGNEAQPRGRALTLSITPASSATAGSPPVSTFTASSSGVDIRV